MQPRQLALEVLCLADPAAKAAGARALFEQVRTVDAAALDIASQPQPAATTGLPGRPPRPLLVPPAEVPRRSPFTPEGRAALLHAIAHIEFNAINLALDAAWRFGGLPPAYHLDWLRVASEEAPHFTLLAARHGAPRPKPPFNHAARLAAGFTPAELAALSKDS